VRLHICQKMNPVAMSYEPRMRGSRFRRQPAKKASAKERKEERGSSVFYQEPEHINPSELCANTVNAIDHLGNQRFALPPFSEHFQRWLNDIKALLADFENRLPEAIDNQYNENVRKLLLGIQEELGKLISIEKASNESLADLQRKLTATESSLSKLEHEHAAQARELRKRYEVSFDKLRKEMDTLDRQRRAVLQQKAGILQRIFKRSDSRLTESANALQVKKNTLGASKDELKKKLGRLGIEYEKEKKQILAEQQTIRDKLAESRGNSLDDAMEFRKAVCQQLRNAVTEAVNRLPKQPDESSPEG
jgi:chromosome segregation ATPase